MTRTTAEWPVREWNMPMQRTNDVGSIKNGTANEESTERKEESTQDKRGRAKRKKPTKKSRASQRKREVNPTFASKEAFEAAVPQIMKYVSDIAPPRVRWYELSASIVDDVVAEVMKKLWNGWWRVPVARGQRAYIWRAVTNLLKNIRKKTPREPVIIQDLPGDDDPDPASASPYVEENLEDVLRVLSPKCPLGVRILALQCELPERTSIEEISLIINETVGKCRFAVRRLRELAEEHFPEVSRMLSRHRMRKAIA